MAVAVSDRRPFVALEITGRCQLTCTHCYASSGVQGTHGTMTAADWMRVLDEAAELGAPLVQLIGGEPTLHPDLPDLVQHALDLHLKVEVYSNLVSVPPALWSVLEQPGVRLATSYYAPAPAGHEAVTRRRHSHDRTLRNIGEARRRGIPIRVGVIQVQEDQDVNGAVAEMRAIGIARVHVDRVREVGRGVRRGQPGVDQLCGRCADGRLAVSPDGRVWPCVFARWLVIGDSRKESLAEVHEAAAALRSELNESFGRRRTPIYGSGSDGGCEPSPCTPIIDGK
jgi:MoaA/NifB/PqqE/SkfB family radical SAM enzyme